MGGNREPESGNNVKLLGSVLFGADEAVSRWVMRRVRGGRVSKESRALGVVKGRNLVAGVVYENFNGVHVEAAIAAEPGSRWADRKTLYAIFHYPFRSLCCQAISVTCPSTNLQSLNLATKLGFEPEAYIRFAAHDGSDLVVLKMYRDKCRWIGRHGEEQIVSASSA